MVLEWHSFRAGNDFIADGAGTRIDKATPMKLNLLGLFLLVAFTPTLSFAQSSFQECLNSCSESCRQKAAVLKDQVARYTVSCGDPDVTTNPQYLCAPSQSYPGKWYMNNVSDNTKLGNYFSSQGNCKASLAFTTREGYHCGESESYPGKAYLGDKADLKLGTYYPDFESCIGSIRRIRGTLICMGSESYPGKFYINNLTNNQLVGGYYSDLNECLSAI